MANIHLHERDYATCKADTHTIPLQMLHKPLEYVFDDHFRSAQNIVHLVASFQFPSNKVTSSSVLRLALYCPLVLYYQFGISENTFEYESKTYLHTQRGTA